MMLLFDNQLLSLTVHLYDADTIAVDLVNLCSVKSVDGRLAIQDSLGSALCKRKFLALRVLRYIYLNVQNIALCNGEQTLIYSHAWSK